MTKKIPSAQPLMKGRKKKNQIPDFTDKQEKLDRLYDSLERIRGIGKTEDPHISENIDEILYGENGAWRGSCPDQWKY